MAFLSARGAVVRFGFAFLLGGSHIRAALGQTTDEYQVKAAFLYNFAKFVEWPPQAFKSPTDPIAICILGEDPFGHALEDAVKGKTIEGRGFVVPRISEVRQADSCQILFVSSAERKRARAILAELRANGVLTVGETEGFAEAGGVINFKLEGGRLRLEINVDAAERAKLRLSSKLLSLAQIVKK
jgi:hypothetical protein